MTEQEIDEKIKQLYELIRGHQHEIDELIKLVIQLKKDKKTLYGVLVE